MAALKVTTGVQGVYRRGQDEIQMTAVPGRTDPAGDVVSDMPILDTDCEWIIDPYDLRISGQRFLPKERDEWEAEIGGERLLFKVLPAAQGEDCYRWSNGYRTMLRVSMKSRGPVNG